MNHGGRHSTMMHRHASIHLLISVNDHLPLSFARARDAYSITATLSAVCDILSVGPTACLSVFLSVRRMTAWPCCIKTTGTIS